MGRNFDCKGKLLCGAIVRKLLVVIVTVASVCSAAGQQPPCRYRSDIAPFVVRATAYLAAGYPHRAKREVEHAIERDSACSILWLLLAKAYRDVGELQPSIAAAERALMLDSTAEDADELLAELYALNNPARAAQHALRALLRDSSLSNRLRAAYLLRASDTVRAIALLREVLAETTAEEIAADLIELCVEHRDTTEAIALLRWALFENPDRPELARMLGLLYAERNQWDSAWFFVRYAFYHMESVDVSTLLGEWLQMVAHSSAPTPILLQTSAFLRERQDLPAYYSLVVAKMLLERSLGDVALVLADALASRRDWGRNDALALCDALAQYGYADRAQQLLEKRDSTTGDWWIPSVQFYLARTYGTLPPDRRLQLLREAFLRDSTDPATLFYAAYYADSLGERGRAIVLYERLLFYDPSNAAAANNLAYILAERGERLAIALELATRALDADSTNPSYLDTYGWVLHKLGRYAEAGEYLERAIALRERPSATLFEHLGDNYSRMGVADKAHFWWQRALEADPSRSYLRARLR
ncbi:Lipopolysaccharide assembly protein B [bacterium HR20]|nr:Lipopolysaccharide assembly protein B [bacterium HR20]